MSLEMCCVEQVRWDKWPWDRSKHRERHSSKQAAEIPRMGEGSLQTAENSSGESNIFLGSGREGTESNPQQEKCEELQKINTGRVHLRLQAPKK